MKTKADYLEYLKSEHWLALRELVLERDGRKCTRCPSVVRLQAHHRFYRAQWEDSQLADLVTLCRACHEKEHGLPVSEPPEKSYLSQIYTWDQLRRSFKFGFITHAQFEKLLPKLEPPSARTQKPAADPRKLIKKIRKRRKRWLGKIRSGSWSH